MTTTDDPTAPRREDPAVEALARVLNSADDEALVRTNFGQIVADYHESARAVLDAIARGEVPGVTLAVDREPDGLRVAVEALAEHWERIGGPDSPRAYGARLRALLAAHPATDQPEVDRG